MNKALDRMVQSMMEVTQNCENRILAISHCNCKERALQLKEKIEKVASFKDIFIVDTAGVRSMYANDGDIIAGSIAHMQYEEIIKNHTIKEDLERHMEDVTAEMMERLEHPETGMKIIHIAGTNGKGSTAAFVSSILHAAGFVVGRFTSPHLIRFTERIVVDGEEIGKDDVIRLGERVLALPMRQGNNDV